LDGDELWQDRLKRLKVEAVEEVVVTPDVGRRAPKRGPRSVKGFVKQEKIVVDDEDPLKVDWHSPPDATAYSPRTTAVSPTRRTRSTERSECHETLHWISGLSAIPSNRAAVKNEETALNDDNEELPTMKSVIKSNVPLFSAEAEYQPAVVSKEEQFEVEPEKKPRLVPTESELELLRLYADDMWKFLVTVAFCEKSNVVDEDVLAEFFVVFPDADSVEKVGWFDVQQLLSRWVACDLTGEELARCIARTSYDYLVLQQEPSVESNGPEVLKFFHRANDFWRSCYDAVFGRENVKTEVARG
jgi:hypothetical protein